MKLLATTLLFAAAPVGFSTCLRGASTVNSIEIEHTKRELASYYYSTSNATILGRANPDAAMSNPLKGLLTSPRWTGGNTPNSVPSTLEFYYIGFDEIATGPGIFNWTVLDATLSDAASRNNHVIWRVFCHYPGQPLRVPQYLIAAGIKLVRIANGSVSPQYDDLILLETFRLFIAAFGKRYDGHKSLGFVQLGLLGYWGEWHTYPDNNLLSTATKDKVVGWYDAAFKTTQMQVRTPLASAYEAGMGLHDDSFAYSTLGPVNWFFMPSVVTAGQTLFWKRGAMGGETRPELQGTIFESGYQAGSDQYKQDFMECVNVTHATYMFHHNAFQGGLSGTELENARRAHARMGYNFQVTSVGVASSSTGTVSVDVTVKQTGVAPFYYPLSLVWSCPGTTATLNGVEGLIEKGASKVFTFQNIPANATCLGNTQILLKSAFVYAGRPLKFAQGSDGKVLLKLPLPGINNPAPVPSPIKAPVPAPVKAPVPIPTKPVPAPFKPVPSPVKAPVQPPVHAPVKAPVPSPTKPVPAPTKPVPAPAPVPAPVPSPGNAPVRYPVAAPMPSPVKAPVASPNKPVPAPTKIPVPAPTKPVPAPTKPVSSPVALPVSFPVKAPIARPVTSSTTLTLINANTDTEIGPLTNGMTINLLSYPSLNVRANLDPLFSTGSVYFTYDGSFFRVENGAPYAFGGNADSDYFSWTPSLGTHTIVATPYSAANAQGTAGKLATVTFTVTNRAPVSTRTSPLFTSLFWFMFG